MFKKIGILLVLVLLAGAGCKKNNPENTAQEPGGTNAELVAEKKALDAAMQTIAANDEDFDGLSFSEEQEAGTDPSNPDTDEDGLTDFDEIRIRKTDPLKPDTDGDGKNDSYEVRRGFDPLDPLR